LEYLLDDLTREQKDILKKYQDTFKFSQELRLKARERLHEIMFNNKTTQEVLTNTFEKYVNKELIHKKEFKNVDKAYHDLFTEILQAITKEQITYSKKAIKDAKKRIKELKKEKF